MHQGARGAGRRPVVSIPTLLQTAHDEDFREWVHRMKCDYSALYGLPWGWECDINPQHYIEGFPPKMMRNSHPKWWREFVARGYVLFLNPDPAHDELVVRRQHHSTLYIRKEQPPTCPGKKPAQGYECRSGWHCECKEI